MQNGSLRNIGLNINSIGNLLFSLPSEEKNLARKLEKLNYKLNAAETAAIFNKICIEEKHKHLRKRPIPLHSTAE